MFIVFVVTFAVFWLIDLLPFAICFLQFFIPLFFFLSTSNVGVTVEEGIEADIWDVLLFFFIPTSTVDAAVFDILDNSDGNMSSYIT